MPQFTSQQIAQHVAGELVGPGDLPVRGIEQLDRAEPDQATFVRDRKNVANWRKSKSRVALVSRSAAIKPEELEPGRAVIHVPSADVAAAKVLAMFAPPPPAAPAGVHPHATVDPSASIAPGASIGPGCRIAANVRIGARTILYPNVTVMEFSEIGDDCVLFPGVVIYDRCKVGHRVRLHANVVIGADGFGYCLAEDGKGMMKIPHIGSVLIGNDVELGAGACVDRGKFAPTTIGDGCKIDNQVQIAHNVRMGRHCVIAGQSGLAGSVTVGDGVMMGGSVNVKDQVTIGSGVMVAACSAVKDDIPDGAVWGGYPAQEIMQAIREVNALHKLPDALKKMRGGKGD